MKLALMGDTLEIRICAGTCFCVEDQRLCSGVFLCGDLAVDGYLLTFGEFDTIHRPSKDLFLCLLGSYHSQEDIIDVYHLAYRRFGE